MTFEQIIFVRLLCIVGLSLLAIGPARALESQTRGASSVVGSLHTARWLHMATLLSDGRVLAVGGIDEAYNAVTNTEVYDPAAATWTVSGPLKNPRHSASATLLPNGNVLVTGGLAFLNSGPLSRFYRVSSP